MIAIQAYMTVRPEKREEFIKNVTEVIEASRKEEGNISYMLTTKVENENEFVMLEEWKDQAAIEAHNTSAHFQKFAGSAKEFLAAPLEVKHYQA
ncbi:putative quinol monooxygenase [Priestia koreensis]|uniref:putative quinol monooxygenase n=1 Tax=Priestia koreensis TaxID=284581 RepID=UPI00345AC758